MHNSLTTSSWGMEAFLSHGMAFPVIQTIRWGRVGPFSIPTQSTSGERNKLDLFQQNGKSLKEKTISDRRYQDKTVTKKWSQDSDLCD